MLVSFNDGQRQRLKDVLSVTSDESARFRRSRRGRGGGGTAVSVYDGMFAVTDTTDYSGEAPYTYTVKVNEGLAQCESKFISVPEQLDLSITQTGYITLEFDVAEEDGAITQDYENKTAGESVDDLALYKGRCIIAGVDISEDKMSLTQLQHNIALVSIRTPEEEEEETP